MHGTEPCKGFVLLALQPQPAGLCMKCHRLVWFSPEFQIWYEACMRRTGGGRPEKKGRKSDLHLTMSKNPTQPNYKMGGKSMVSSPPTPFPPTCPLKPLLPSALRHKVSRYLEGIPNCPFQNLERPRDISSHSSLKSLFHL